MVEMRSALASSSPASQGGTATNTPATRITASAPHTVFNGKGNDDGLAKALSGLTINPLATSDDPFLDPASAADDAVKISGLSPIASTFTPGNSGPSALTSSEIQENYNAGPSFIPQASNSSTAVVATALQNNGPPSGNALPNVPTGYTRLGSFTSEWGPQRSVLINSEFPIIDRIRHLVEEAGVDGYKIHRLGRAVNSLGGLSKCLLEFRDPAVAAQAFSVLRLNLDRATLCYLTPKGAADFHGLDANQISRYEGEIVIMVLGRGSSLISLPEATIDQQVLISMSRRFGTVKAFDRSEPSGGPRCYRLEFASNFSTERALSFGPRHGVETSFGIIYIAKHQPDLDDPNWSTYGLPEASQTMGPVMQATGRPQASLTGRSVLPPGMAIGTSAFGPLIQAPMRRRPQNDNRIDIDAIKHGEDIRTTIMLRNIPNRVDIHLLKEIIDQTSKGKYDFVYLRIDFQNQCNVGYAFINFSDAMSIVPFAEARQGIRWTVFDSDKIAELSYATIQDRANLIQKFRNSSVMLEHPDYRPKLFFSDPDPRSGQEEPFPDPDNLQKMRRSMENAETIGLFRPIRGRPNTRFSTRTTTPFTRSNRPLQLPRGRPGVFLTPACVAPQALATPRTNRTARPRAITPITYTPPSTPLRLFAPRQGQAYREEQRRRRSQFDRGTTGAELELQHGGVIHQGMPYHLPPLAFFQPSTAYQHPPWYV